MSLNALPSVAAEDRLKQAIKVFTLRDYVAQGVMTEAQHACIVSAVRMRRNVIVSGGTGLGKTTLADEIIGCITDVFPDDRPTWPVGEPGAAAARRPSWTPFAAVWLDGERTGAGWARWQWWSPVLRL